MPHRREQCAPISCALGDSAFQSGMFSDCCCRHANGVNSSSSLGAGNGLLAFSASFIASRVPSSHRPGCLVDVDFRPSVEIFSRIARNSFVRRHQINSGRIFSCSECRAARDLPRRPHTPHMRSSAHSASRDACSKKDAAIRTEFLQAVVRKRNKQLMRSLVVSGPESCRLEGGQVVLCAMPAGAAKRLAMIGNSDRHRGRYISCDTPRPPGLLAGGFFSPGGEGTITPAARRRCSQDRAARFPAADILIGRDNQHLVDFAKRFST